MTLLFSDAGTFAAEIGFKARCTSVASWLIRGVKEGFTEQSRADRLRRRQESYNKALMDVLAKMRSLDQSSPQRNQLWTKLFYDCIKLNAPIAIWIPNPQTQELERYVLHINDILSTENRIKQGDRTPFWINLKNPVQRLRLSPNQIALNSPPMEAPPVQEETSDAEELRR